MTGAASRKSEPPLRPMRLESLAIASCCRRRGRIYFEARTTSTVACSFVTRSSSMPDRPADVRKSSSEYAQVLDESFSLVAKIFTPNKPVAPARTRHDRLSKNLSSSVGGTCCSTPFEQTHLGRQAAVRRRLSAEMTSSLGRFKAISIRVNHLIARIPSNGMYLKTVKKSTNPARESKP